MALVVVSSHSVPTTVKIFVVAASRIGLAFAPILLATTEVFAQETKGVTDTAKESALTSLDWALVAIYGTSMIALGIWCSRRQQSVKDFFVAGGKMGAFVVGISIHATLLSSITYLSHPGEMIRSGPVLFCNTLSYPIAFFVVGYWLIPAIMKHRVTSAYEIVNARFGLSARWLAALIFLSLRLVWMAVMLNFFSNALVEMLSLPPESQPWIVAISATIAIGYTALGGLRAVIITDTVQFFLLFGGALFTVLLITFKFGGFDWFPTQWYDHWDTQPVFSFDPYVRVTMVGSIMEGLLWWMCTAGSDQTTVQRYMATPDEKTARRSFLINACAAVGSTFLLAMVGFAILGFYVQNPELMPEEATIRSHGDNLFPRFIAHELPAGISGLVIVALFAAMMSSIDSGINAVTAVVLTDFIGPLRKRAAEPLDDLRLSRYLTVVIGIVVVLMNLAVAQASGNYAEITAKTVNLLVAPLFGLFFFALFVPRSKTFGVIFGSLYGSAAAILVGFWDVITGLDPFSFQWITPVAMAVNAAVGFGLSRLPSERWSRSQTVSRAVFAALPIVITYAIVIILT